MADTAGCDHNFDPLCSVVVFWQKAYPLRSSRSFFIEGDSEALWIPPGLHRGLPCSGRGMDFGQNRRWFCMEFLCSFSWNLDPHFPRGLIWPGNVCMVGCALGHGVVAHYRSCSCWLVYALWWRCWRSFLRLWRLLLWLLWLWSRSRTHRWRNFGWHLLLGWTPSADRAVLVWCWGTWKYRGLVLELQWLLLPHCLVGPQIPAHAGQLVGWGCGAFLGDSFFCCQRQGLSRRFGLYWLFGFVLDESRWFARTQRMESPSTWFSVQVWCSRAAVPWHWDYQWWWNVLPSHWQRHYTAPSPQIRWRRQVRAI